MRKASKAYTIESKGWWRDSVLITEKHGWNYYDNKPVNEYLEVSIEVDRSKMEITSWHYRLLTNPDDPLARWVSNPESFVSQEALQEARAALEKRVKSQIPAMVRKGKRHPAYKAMSDEVKHSKGMLKHYREDFTYHDMLMLGNENPARFVWILRDCGTWLLREYNDWGKAIFESPDRSSQYYTWNGSVLSRVDMREAERFLKGY